MFIQIVITWGAEVMKKREGEEGNWKASEEKEGGRGRKGEWVC